MVEDNFILLFEMERTSNEQLFLLLYFCSRAKKSYGVRC